MELTLLSVIVRVSVMYVAALVFIRLSGKRSISELTTMDFAVVTILGDAFDSVIFSEVPVLQGIVYFASITTLHVLTRFLSSRSTWVHRLTASPPAVMIQNGMLVWESLAHERTRVETVWAEMRLQGEDRLEEVKEARLEESGRLSVLHKPSRKPVQRQDRKLLER